MTGTARVQPVREEPEVATETSGEGKPLEGSAMSSSPTRPWGEGVESAGDVAVSDDGLQTDDGLQSVTQVVRLQWELQFQSAGPQGVLWVTKCPLKGQAS